MPTLKKLIFASVFLIFFILLLFQLSPIFKSYDFIFSLSVNTLVTLITISILIMLSSFSFVLFATIAFDWKLILGVGLLASLAPLLFFDPSLGLILGVGVFASLILIFVTLENNLKSYLNFNPNTLLGSSIRYLSSFLILVLALIYFLAANRIISQSGFEIPDSLIDTALDLTSSSQPATEDEQTTTLPQISPQQLELLKQNPDLLRQYGLDPSILDTLSQPQKDNKSSTKPDQSLIKQAVKDQLQNIIKPYLGFVPVTLAVLLFITLESIVSFLTILIYPILWIIFYILEKTGFVKFTEEMRSVKKMIV